MCYIHICTCHYNKLINHHHVFIRSKFSDQNIRTEIIDNLYQRAVDENVHYLVETIEGADPV